jgi:hypothetical protein
LLNHQWVIEEIREEIKKLLEFNENENTTCQNLWGTAKAVLRGKLIPISVYIKNTERSQINDLMLHLKLLIKQEQAQPKPSRKREISKIRSKMNEIDTDTDTHTHTHTHAHTKPQRINETKSWFFLKK